MHKLTFISDHLTWESAVSRISFASVDRAKVFETSFHSILDAKVSTLRQGVESVSYLGETGSGVGVVRDWFSAFAIDSIDRQVGLFKLRDDTFPHYRYIDPVIRPDDGYPRKKMIASNSLQNFRAIGRFMAPAIIEGVSPGYDFPIMFYGSLLEKDISLNDIRPHEPEIYSSMLTILHANSVAETRIEEMEIRGVVHPLTLKNRDELVHLYINSLIPQNSMRYIEQIRSGLVEVLTEEVFRTFSPETLRRLMRGTSDFDPKQLRDITKYQGEYHKDHLVIKNFWAVQKSFTYDDRSKFLYFITSSRQLPLGGLSGTRKPFTIAPGSDVGGYPTTMTCTFTFFLPRHPTVDMIRQKLVLAMEQAEQGMFRYRSIHNSYARFYSISLLLCCKIPRALHF
jgi:hypothetical protein